MVEEIKNYKIYALVEPLTNKEFYIGHTQQKNINVRLSGHIADVKKHCNKNIHKERKINKILNEDLKHIIRVLEDNITTLELTKQRERYWISYYRELLGKNKLCNISDGGDWNPVTDSINKDEIVKKLSPTKIAQGKIKKQEKMIELGLSSLEELAQYEEKEQKEKRKAYREANLDEMKAKGREVCKIIRNRLREEMGEVEYKKMVAQKKLDYVYLLTEEQYNEKKQKENEYWKNRRRNEFPEEKKLDC